MNTNEIDGDVKITMVSDDGIKTKLAISNNEYRNGEVGLNDGTKNSRDARCIKSERSKSLDIAQLPDRFDPIRKRISSIMSIGDLGGNIILVETSNKKDGKW